MSSTWIENGESIIVFELNDSNQIITVIKKGFLSKVEVKFSYVQNWLAFAKVGGTVPVKSEYCPACTSGTRTATTKWEAYF